MNKGISAIDKIKTHCGNCVFVKRDRDGEQSGCALNRLETYKKSSRILEWDFSQAAFVIHDLCSTCRDKNWQPTATIDEAIEAIKQEVRVRFDFVVVLDNKSNYQDNLAQYFQTVESILQQTILPETVIIVSDNQAVNERIADFVKETVKPHFENSKVQFQVVRNLETPSTFADLVDIGVSKCKNQFYSALLAGEVVPNDMVAKIEDAINVKLFNVALVKCNETYPMVVQTALHKMLGGYYKEPVDKKITDLAQKYEKTNRIKEWIQL